MHLLVHLAANTLLGGLLSTAGVIESWGIFLLFVSFAALIDLDHTVYFAITERTLSIKKFWAKHLEYHSKMEPHLYIFHSPEFLLLTAVLALNHYLWGLLLASNLLHLSLDALEHYLHNKNFNEFREWSISVALWKHFRRKSAARGGT